MNTEKLAEIYVKKIRKVCAECEIEEAEASRNKLDMDKAYQKSQIRIERTLNNYFFKRRKILNNRKKKTDTEILETHNYQELHERWNSILRMRSREYEHTARENGKVVSEPSIDDICNEMDAFFTALEIFFVSSNLK